MWKKLERCLCVGARGQRGREGGWFSLINAHPSRIRSVKFAFAFISSLFFTSPADSFSAASCWETLSDSLSAVKARWHSRAHLPLASVYFSAVPRSFLAKARYWKPKQNRWNRCKRRTFFTLPFTIDTQLGRSLLYRPHQSIDTRLSLSLCCHCRAAQHLSSSIPNCNPILYYCLFWSFSSHFLLFSSCLKVGGGEGLSRP